MKFSISSPIQKELIKKKPYLSLYLQDSKVTNNFLLEYPSNTTNQSSQKSFIENPQKNSKLKLNLPIIYSNFENKKRALSSKYDSEKEALEILFGSNLKNSIIDFSINNSNNQENSFKNSNNKESSFTEAKYKKFPNNKIVVVLGLGNLYILPILQKILNENQICIIVCAFFELGQLLCKNCDVVWEFLERPGSHIFFGNELHLSFENYLETLPIENFRGFQIFKHNPLIKLAPDFFNNCEDTIRKVFKARLSDLLTRFNFEALWLKNIIKNTSYLPGNSKNNNSTNHTIKDYQNFLLNIPAVLVSAGPSLAESLDDIRLLSKKAFILCVDTALKILLNAGIKPNAVITLDAQIHTLFSFQGLDLNGIILFTDIASNPSILSKIKLDKVIFSTTAQISKNFQGLDKKQYTGGTQYAQNVYGEIGYLQSGGSVATSGFDLLRVLGCEPIFLVGQDLAYTDRKIHSMGTYHTYKFLTKINRTKSMSDIIENIISKRKTNLIDSLENIYSDEINQNYKLENHLENHLENKIESKLGNNIENYIDNNIEKYQENILVNKIENKIKINQKKVLGDHALNLYKSWFENAIQNSEKKVYQITKKGAVLNNAIYIKEINNFINNMKLLDNENKINDLYKISPKLKKYFHIETNELVKILQNTIKNKNEIAIDNLFEKYYFLRCLTRLIQMHIKRNEGKFLDNENKKEFIIIKTIEILKKFERSLRQLCQN